MLTVVATLEFSYFLGLCLPALSKSVYFKCQIGPLHYDCTGHPGQFYVLLCNYIININNNSFIYRLILHGWWNSFYIPASFSPWSLLFICYWLYWCIPSFLNIYDVESTCLDFTFNIKYNIMYYYILYQIHNDILYYTMKNTL